MHRSKHPNQSYAVEHPTVFFYSGFDIDEADIQRAADLFDIDIESELDYLPSDVREMFEEIIPTEDLEAQDNIFPLYVRLINQLPQDLDSSLFPKM